MELRIANQDGSSETQERLTQSSGVTEGAEGTRGPRWYQGSRSLESSGEGEKTALGPFVVTKTVN